MKTIKDLLEGHVTLTVESIDRMYLNGYIPTMQQGSNVTWFLSAHRGNPIPSPVLLDRITKGFKQAVEAYAASEGLPITQFKKGERKDDIAAEHRKRFKGRLSRASRSNDEGVYLIGVAQEKSSAFKAGKRKDEGTGRVGFEYTRQSVFVNQYYFYLVDEDFGPAFIKIGTYAPYPVRACFNGHEWAKRQMEKAKIGFEALDNGFAACDDPAKLQKVCNSLGPDQITAFLRKWLDRLPLPLTSEDRQAGYDWRFSIWQMEVSRTQVFERPVQGRQFFEEVIRENLDLGRPDRMQLLFDRRITKKTPGRFCTRVIQNGVFPSLHVEYKSCHIKQYFKENRALRTETTINNPGDFGVGKDLSNFWTLQTIGRDINNRLLEAERVSQHCTLTQDTVESITHPTVGKDGQRAPGLRLGHPRTKALFWALLLMCFLPKGFSNLMLRERMASLLGPGVPYQGAQMTYDLRRLRLKGLIERIPNSRRYRLTETGLRAAAFFTKLDARVFRAASPCLGLDDALPRPLRIALQNLEKAVDQLVANARFDAAA